MRVRCVLTVLTLSDSSCATCETVLPDGEHLEDLELPVREALVRRALRLAGHERRQRLGELGAHVATAAGDLAHGLDQLSPARSPW